MKRGQLLHLTWSRIVALLAAGRKYQKASLMAMATVRSLHAPDAAVYLQVLYNPSKGHGGWLLSRSWGKKVLDGINEVLTVGEQIAIKCAKVQ
jgi:hypothetical protein